MTEQPIETEQQFLGNAPTTTGAPTVLELLDDAQAKGEALAKARQHYVPGAHLRRPSWSPVDDVELAALVRKCVNASKLLAIAKAESAKAEDALSHALEVEDTAATAVLAAEQALIAFTRKDTGL